MDKLTEYAFEFFGWVPPACWECGFPMIVWKVNKIDHIFSPTQGQVEYWCGNYGVPHESRLRPFVVFQRQAGVDKILEYGWF